MSKAHKKNTSQQDKEPLATITFQSSTALKNAFKAQVSSEGKSVRDVLCLLMERYLKSK